MSDNDPIISTRSIIALVCLGVGAFIDWAVYHSQPPLRFLFAIFCLFIVFDALDGIKNRVKRIEGKLDAILKKLSGG